MPNPQSWDAAQRGRTSVRVTNSNSSLLALRPTPSVDVLGTWASLRTNHKLCSQKAHSASRLKNSMATREYPRREASRYTASDGCPVGSSSMLTFALRVIFQLKLKRRWNVVVHFNHDDLGRVSAVENGPQYRQIDAVNVVLQSMKWLGTRNFRSKLGKVTGLTLSIAMKTCWLLLTCARFRISASCQRGSASMARPA